MTRTLVARLLAWSALALLLPACGVGGGGTLTPTVAPGVPTGLIVRAGNKSVTLDWKASAQGAQYVVQRSLLSQGPFFPISVPSQFPKPTRYVDSGLTNATTYYYQVVAVNAFGQSAPSAAASGTPGFRATAVATGSWGSDMLALLPDGTVWEWGVNGLGLMSDVPLQVPTLVDVTAISDGGFHHLALSNDGHVWAWGSDSYGEIGDGGPLGVNAPVPVEVVHLTDVVAVSAGQTYSLALSHDGTVWAWGDNSQGQFGLGTSTPASSSTPQQVPGVSNIVAIAAGAYHALALRADGLVYSWGQNPYGQLGNGSSDASQTDYAPAQVTSLTGVVTVSAGTYTSIALRKDGTVWSWGFNADGALGIGSASSTSVTVPTQTLTPTGIVGVSGGGTCSIAVRDDGTAWSWGDNQNGQLGIGSSGTTPVTTPVQVQGITAAVQAAASVANAISVDRDGTVRVWGDNGNGQLGNGTAAVGGIPAQMTNVTGVVSVAAGDGFSIVARTSGTVFGWGADGTAQLGIGLAFSPNTSTAVQTVTLSTAVSVAAGASHTLALLSTGALWGWGSNANDQVGDGTSGGSKASPVAVAIPAGVVAMSAGNLHSLAIHQDSSTQVRTVWSWGENALGELGNGSSSTPIATPAAVPGLPGAVGVAAGGRHSLAVLSDGSVWAWGGNSSGQLGLGTTDATPHPTPTQVTGVTGAIAVAAGQQHSLALRSDGTLMAWGQGTSGELGNGMKVQSSTPVSVSGLTGVTAISAGNAFSLALGSNGTVWSWGDNSLGQLGTTGLTGSSTPIQVFGLPGVTAISAGYDHAMALVGNQTVWLWGDNQGLQLGAPYVTQSTTPVVVSP